MTRAIDYLRADGFGYNCPADLVDQEAAPVALPSRSLAQVRDAIAQARHTSQVADALSELTAPGDGVLDQTVGLLRQTASWWEGLGRGVDPHYASRLRYIADLADGYATEVRAMRGVLADRHAPHPGRSRSTDPAAAPAEARVTAALATSPAATRTPIGRHADAAPAAAAVPVRPTAPSR
ncbi:hypothetical protein [Kitasatospora griseola]|uniref:hypothetical protein n=1 Tax=Kitasatospora griseola TaxID=2064 RepID=UPI0034453FC7